jgi:hypothetical protein
MIGPQTALAETPLAETRTFGLMALGAREETDEPIRTHSLAPELPALVGARPFAIMANGALEEDAPQSVPADLAA